MQIQSTAVVRDRFQLTIPDSVREGISWVTPGSVVSIYQNKDEELVIKPYVGNAGRVNWDRLWRDISQARSYKGSYEGSLSEFITSDRENH